jgi:hypothetical protein
MPAIRRADACVERSGIGSGKTPDSAFWMVASAWRASANARKMRRV